MDKAAIIQIIRDRLGFNEDLNSAIILRHLDFVQADYERGEVQTPLPWFLFDVDNTASTVIDQPYVSLPTDFLAWSDDWPFWILDAEGKKHILKPKKPYEVEGHNLEAKLPEAFSFGGTQVRLHPAPDKVYTIHLPCFKKSEALSVATTSPWFSNFPTLIVEETIYSIAKGTRDLEALKLAGVDRERSSYFARVEEMKHVMMDYTKGTYDAS